MDGRTNDAGAPRAVRMSINCPHCGAYARVRTSRSQTATVRTAQLECSNFECGHVFGAQLAVTHTIAPSRKPNPEIALPIAPARGVGAHNDNGGEGGPHAPPASAACPSSAAAAS